MDTQPITTDQENLPVGEDYHPPVLLPSPSSHLVPIILSSLITMIVLVGAYFLLFLNKTPQTITTNPSPSSTSSAIAVSSSNPISKIPIAIDKIYTAINQDFDVNITPTLEPEFYSLQGFIKKESWKLDLSSILTDKPQITKLYQILEKYLQIAQGSGAGGVGQIVEGYENDEVYCFLLMGFNQSDYISCILK